MYAYYIHYIHVKMYIYQMKNYGEHLCMRNMSHNLHTASTTLNLHTVLLHTHTHTHTHTHKLRATCFSTNFEHTSCITPSYFMCTQWAYI